MTSTDGVLSWIQVTVMPYERNVASAPVENAERFVPSPWAAQGRARMPAPRRCSPREAPKAAR